MWTLLQGTFATEAIALLNLDPWVAVPLMGLLSGVKSLLAGQFGDGTAATLPSPVERF